MQSFKNILVVADEPSLAQSAIETAARLAAPASGIVTLLAPGQQSPPTLRRGNRTAPRRRSSPLHRLYDPGPQLRRMGVPVHHDFANGPIHAQALDRIYLHGHDLLIVANRRDRGFAGRSLAGRLLRTAPIPVWIQGETPSLAGPVAVAVGPADEEDPDDRLAQELVETASELAATHALPLHVVHAWRLTGETLMRSSRLSYQPTDIERMGRAAVSEAYLRVEHLLAGSLTPNIATRVHVQKGHVSDVVPEVVRAIEPSLLVMGTLSRRGISGMVVGNSVERLADRVNVPLLAVKPNGIANATASIEDWSPHALPY